MGGGGEDGRRSLPFPRRSQPLPTTTSFPYSPLGWGGSCVQVKRNQFQARATAARSQRRGNGTRRRRTTTKTIRRKEEEEEYEDEGVDEEDKQKRSDTVRKEGRKQARRRRRRGMPSSTRRRQWRRGKGCALEKRAGEESDRLGPRRPQCQVQRERPGTVKDGARSLSPAPGAPVESRSEAAAQ